MTHRTDCASLIDRGVRPCTCAGATPPPDAQAMTREELQECDRWVETVGDDPLAERLVCKLIRLHKAQCETIRRLEAEQRVLDAKYVDERAARMKAEDDADQYYKCLQIEKGEHARALQDRDTAQARLTASEAKGLTNDMIDSIGRNLNSRCDNGCGTAARELICQALAQGPLTPGEE